MRNTVVAISVIHKDIYFIKHYDLQLAGHKSELMQIRNALLSAGDEVDVRDQLSFDTRLESVLFECLHHVRKILRNQRVAGHSPSDATLSEGSGTGVRLSKLDVPTFDGMILNWRQWWEQFCLSIHNRSTLSNAEKLVYLQHLLKDGSAKTIIQGLPQSGEQHNEAVEYLIARFDCPCLLHQTHVKMLLDTPSIHKGNGQELKCLHEMHAKQHIHALKTMGQEPSPAFITSLIELDSSTMFEWQ